MHPKLLKFRYKLFKYRYVEQRVARERPVRRFLDIGCGDGENLLRFDGVPAHRVGLEVSMSRLEHARHKLGLDVFQASGARLPFADDAFDMIYIAHVLHHVLAYGDVLAEIRRCLAPGGAVFIVETVTDHPILRLGRAIHPFWHGDKVEADWRYAELRTILEQSGFVIEETGRYNIIFWLWEIFPLTFWPFEILTPIFVYLDLFLTRFLRRYVSHCYFVLTAAP